eukprot:TRINITY_DN10204_c0_g1_i1.p1 TRINITY_DN10204_c0_g1~~TRINITY_DN10204_c0_g1_i1.p1  ORF type:complete len:220 (+),score=20.78 TRINITY_DN10204_c0_g1_i1:26-661(+)
MLRRPMTRGCLFVLEGLDRCGKSTQANLLSQRPNTDAIRFPDRTSPTGQLINAYLASAAELDDRAVHLLFSANRWEKRAVITEAMRAGRSVVADRYAHSGVAFTSAKGIDQKWCRGPENGLPRPDAVFYMELSEGVAETRGGFGQERYEKPEFQKAVSHQFSALSALSGGATRWIRINAGESIENVQAEILAHMASIEKECAETEIGTIDW